MRTKNQCRGTRQGTRASRGLCNTIEKEKRKDRPSKKGVKKAGSVKERRNATDKV